MLTIGAVDPHQRAARRPWARVGKLDSPDKARIGGQNRAAEQKQDAKNQPKHAATTCANARARWLIACFASGSISPHVAVRPRGTNIGS